MAAELKHMANFFKMAVGKSPGSAKCLASIRIPLSMTHYVIYKCLFTAYKDKIGLKCQFLIEPKPKEPCKHQYDYGRMQLLLKPKMNEETPSI